MQQAIMAEHAQTLMSASVELITVIRHAPIHREASSAAVLVVTLQAMMEEHAQT